ncbi:hypothetical protein AGMMS50276_13240 [Synergistales bacterium]|nr:hypothetical protein AGMMS50276_13240 [Synergistales bacterium]
MKKAVIFGAGQCGKWLRRLLGASGFDVVGFVDNDPARAGQAFEGCPVFSPSRLSSFEWDALFLAMKGQDRVDAVTRQLAELGVFDGRVKTLPSFLTDFDARYLELNTVARTVHELNIPGATAELGVYKGDFAADINRAFSDRTLYLFDTFEGFCEHDVKTERDMGLSKARVGDFGDTDVESVRAKLPFPEKTVFKRGVFPETASGLDEEFCFVSLDADLYQPTLEGLEYFYPRLGKGGVILLHDFDSDRFRGVGEAARRFCSEQGLYIQNLWDMHGSALLRKQ